MSRAIEALRRRSQTLRGRCRTKNHIVYICPGLTFRCFALSTYEYHAEMESEYVLLSPNVLCVAGHSLQGEASFVDTVPSSDRDVDYSLISVTIHIQTSVHLDASYDTCSWLPLSTSSRGWVMSLNTSAHPVWLRPSWQLCIMLGFLRTTRSTAHLRRFPNHCALSRFIYLRSAPKNMPPSKVTAVHDLPTSEAK